MSTSPIAPVTFSLEGEPVAWARTRPGKKGNLFNPTKQRDNTAALQLMAKVAMAGRAPFDCPVRMNVHAEFSIPSSWSKRKQQNAIVGLIRPGKVPDLSNILKQVEDACNKIVYRDDALIVEYGMIRKVYGLSPRVVVTVSAIEANQ